MKIFRFTSNFEKDKCRDREIFLEVIHILMTDYDFQSDWDFVVVTWT